MPDVYDAGAVRAHADLNRDPFIEGLQICRQQGREFAREKFTATAAVDTVNARRELAQLQIMMRRVSEEHVDVRVDTDGVAAAIAELEALRREQARVDRETVTSSRTRVAANREVTKSLSLMRTAIELLGPPLVPIAGAAAGAATAFIGLGVAGIAALKGIQAEYKAGTALGLKYAGMLRDVKAEMAVLGNTAAKGVFDGLNQALAVGNMYLPEFNVHLADSSRRLGEISQHLVGGLIGGFNAWYPLISKAEAAVGGLVTKFETWATGPAGASFMQTLIMDMQQAGPAIGDILHAVSDLVAAFNPVGLGLLSGLGALGEAISAIPIEILQAGATAYIAFRTAVIASKGFDVVAGMLYRLSGAELAAARSATVLAAAQSRAVLAGGAAGAAAARGAGTVASMSFMQKSAGWLAAGTRALAPFAIGWVVASVGINSAASATEKWKDSTDTLNQTLYTTTRVAKDILSFNWGDIPDAFSHAYQQGKQWADTLHEQRVINSYLGQYTPELGAGVVTPYSQAHPQTVETTPAQTIPVLGLKTGGQSQQNYAVSVAAARKEMAGYKTTLDAARIAQNALYGAQSRLTAAGMQGTAAWRQNRAAIADNNAALQEAFTNYNSTRQAIRLYNEQVARDAHQQAATSTRYAGGQASRYAQADQLALGSAPSVTAGTAALDAYQKSLQKAIQGEGKWLAVTSDDTVQIGQNTYAREAWDRAVVAGNGNRNKAIGLLEGHTVALHFEQQQMDLASEQQTRLNDAIGQAELKYQLTDAQLNSYSAALGVSSEQLATGEVSTRRFLAELGRVQGVVDNGSTAINGWVAAAEAFSAGADTAASRAQLIGAALVSFNGDAISYGATMAHAADANQQFVDAFRNMHKSVVNLKTGFINFRNAGAAPVLDALQNLQTQAMGAAAATYQFQVAHGHSARAAKYAADVYRNDTTAALVAEHTQLDITRGEAEKLAQRYFHWPKNAKTQIEALGAKDTNALLDALGRQLAILTGHPWLINVHANVDARQVAALRQQILNMPDIGVSVNATGITHLSGGGGYAKGGKVREGYFTVGEEGGQYGWELGYKRGRDVQFLSNRDSRARTGWRVPPANVPQYASGTGPGGFVGVTGAGGTGTGSGTSTGTGGSGSGTSGPTAAQQQANTIRREIEALLRELTHDTIGNRTLKQLDKAASSTVLGYANSLLEQAKHALKLNVAGVDSEFVRGIRAETSALRRDLKERDKLAQQRQRIDARIAGIRQKMAQEQSTVAQGILGGFDIGTAGNGYTAGIAATLEQQLADARKFRDLRAQAKNLGLSHTLLRQITREGPATGGANLEAIVAGGRKYVQGINTDYSALAKLANNLGGRQANEIYGQRLHDDQRRLHHVAEQQRDATRHVNDTLRDIRHDLTALRRDVTDDRRRNAGAR